jgi:hypothetical protein
MDVPLTARRDADPALGKACSRQAIQRGRALASSNSSSRSLHIVAAVQNEAARPTGRAVFIAHSALMCRGLSALSARMESCERSEIAPDQ